MSLSALLQQQRQDIERSRLASSSGGRAKPVVFPRDYLSSRQGGSRPSRAASTMDTVSPDGRDVSPPRSHTSLGNPPAPKSHLTDSLNLTLSILRRYKREHLKVSPEEAVLLAEVAGYHTDVNPGGSAPESPMTSTTAHPDGAPPGFSRPRRGSGSSKNLLNKIRGIVHNPQMYRDMVSMKTNVKNLTQFTVECAGCTTNLGGLYDLIYEQIAASVASDDGNETPLQIFVVDATSREQSTIALVDIRAKSARVVGKDEPIVNASGIHLEAEGVYVPFTVDGEIFGVAYFPDAGASFLSDQRRQQLSAVAGVAGLTLRTAIQFERLEHQARKNADMLQLARGIASAQLTEAEIVERVMDSAKSLVNCSHCAFHFVSETGELRLTADEDDDGPGLTTEPSSLGGGTSASSETLDAVAAALRGSLAASVDIASNVALRGDTIMINDPKQLPDSVRDIEKATGIRLENILCVPVRNSDDRVIGVAQLSNKEPRDMGGVLVPQHFTQMDETLMRTYANFAAVSLGNARSKTELVAEKAKSDAVLDVVKYLAECDIRDVNSVVNQVMQGAKNLLQADRASLFLIDEERDELYSKVADSTGGQEIRFPVGKGIAGTVARTGNAEVIHDAYHDSRFNRDVDKQLGYRTRTILAEPISFHGDTLAVAQLVNKIDPATRKVKRFSKQDQETFRTFALFAGISLSNSRLLEFVIRAGEEAMALNQAQFGDDEKVSRRTSSMRSVSAVTDAERSRVRQAPCEEQWLAAATTRKFNLFAVREAATDGHQARDIGARIVMEVFKATGFLDKFNVEELTLYNFVIRCRSKYRNVPYHNFFHAVDAVQTIYTYLFHAHAKDKLTDLEAFVLLVAALCHDLDHMGVNNNFHMKTDSPLGLLSSASGNKSVLEVHHCNIAVEILQDPNSNMFEGLSKEDVSTAYRCLIDAILATDMARHGDMLTAYTAICNEGYDINNQAHRTTMMQMLLKAADVSNVTKPFEVSRLWAISVTEEFYQQGDKEREQGVEVNPMFDRTAGGELAKGQLGFINFVAKKFFQLLTGDDAVPGMKWAMAQLESNVETWQSMLAPASPK